MREGQLTPPRERGEGGRFRQENNSSEKEYGGETSWQKRWFVVKASICLVSAVRKRQVPSNQKGSTFKKEKRIERREALQKEGRPDLNSLLWL